MAIYGDEVSITAACPRALKICEFRVSMDDLFPRASQIRAVSLQTYRKQSIQ